MCICAIHNCWCSVFIPLPSSLFIIPIFCIMFVVRLSFLTFPKRAIVQFFIGRVYSFFFVCSVVACSAPVVWTALFFIRPVDWFLFESPNLFIDQHSLSSLLFSTARVRIWDRAKLNKWRRKGERRIFVVCFIRFLRIHGTDMQWVQFACNFFFQPPFHTLFSFHVFTVAHFSNWQYDFRHNRIGDSQSVSTINIV